MQFLIEPAKMNHPDMFAVLLGLATLHGKEDVFVIEEQLLYEGRVVFVGRARRPVVQNSRVDRESWYLLLAITCTLLPEWRWQTLFREQLGERNIPVDVEIEGGDMEGCERNVRSDGLKELDKVMLCITSVAREAPWLMAGKGKGSSGRWGFTRLVVHW